jgi:hypothetical protein
MAFSFNGTSYIEATSTPVTAEPFTMACWFNPAVVTDGALMSIGNSATTNRFQMSSNIAQPGSALSISSVGASTATVNTTTAIGQNRWQHAAAVCTRTAGTTTLAIYLNGAGKNTTTTTVSPVGINNIMTGGRWSGGTRAFFFNGRIAEVAIWNAALTDDEVLSLSKGFAPSLIRPSNLRFYNRCLQRSQDLSGGRTLTQVNITNFDHPRIYG